MRQNLLSTLCFLTPGWLAAAVTPDVLFSDHAVLQQGIQVPVWGTARAGEKVTITFQGQTLSTEASATGTWRLTLAPLTAGGPFEMTLSGDNQVTIHDLLVGEVWVCSGQSNMERQLGPRPPQKPLLNWEQEAAAANYPQIRHFGVAQKRADQPATSVIGTWEVCSPQTAPKFTAVGYFFGRDLHLARKVPIGLIHSSVGGTPAQAWTRHEALAANPELKVILDSQEQAIANYAVQLAKYHADEPKLSAAWQEAVAQAKKDGKPEPRKPAPPGDPQTNGSRPSGLYNAMIAPLQPYAIKGVIWYQGESNAGQSKLYRTLFPAMIADWRKTWGQGEFPFLFVQIAPFKGMPPEIREAQLLSWQKTPNTAMVVTTDVGDANDIHPANKAPVGNRLSLAARALAYGENLAYSGPVFKSASFADGKAVVSFTQVNQGLLAKDGHLKGFTIAGADKKFVPAQAEITGETITVSSPEVTQPTAVRYGWANVPEVNLFNRDGLPASPFRSDIE
jgi:sialate O-acetylesterase